MDLRTFHDKAFCIDIQHLAKHKYVMCSYLYLVNDLSHSPTFEFSCVSSVGGEITEKPLIRADVQTKSQQTFSVYINI